MYPVVVSYDGDEAGLNATYKFGKLAASIGLIVEVVDNELGLDPDEIIEAYGFEELFSLSKKRYHGLIFFFVIFRNDTTCRIIRNVKSLLKKLPNKFCY